MKWAEELPLYNFEDWTFGREKTIERLYKRLCKGAARVVIDELKKDGKIHLEEKGISLSAFDGEFTITASYDDMLWLVDIYDKEQRDFISVKLRELADKVDAIDD